MQKSTIKIEADSPQQPGRHGENPNISTTIGEEGHTSQHQRARSSVEGQDLDSLIKSIIVNPDAVVKEPPTVISVNNLPVCTLGNFSLIIGRAKSRKTFLVSSIATAALSGSCTIENVTGSMPPGCEVHYFDTEQSTFHLHKTVSRIVAQAGDGNFKAYEMRPLSASVRVKVIEYVVDHLVGPAFIIIDGLRDLMSRGINDEEEATDVVSKFLKWTHVKNCHIMLILHQNKNDQNARGHIGTEAVNKAETVIKLVKDKDITKVVAEFCRDIDFEPFSFMIDSEGLPQGTLNKPAAGISAKADNMSVTLQKILSGRAMKHNDLEKRYMDVGKVSEATAKRRIKEAKDMGIIIQNDEGHYKLKTEEET